MPARPKLMLKQPTRKDDMQKLRRRKRSFEKMDIWRGLIVKQSTSREW
jgi:hypothetical protein